MKSLVRIAFAAVFALPAVGHAADEASGSTQVVAAAASMLVREDNAPVAGKAGASAVGAVDPLLELEAAAHSGDARAQIALGIKYTFAEGVPRDQTKAHQLFCRAARYGNADGLYHLGWAYANGRGVSHDDVVAARLFGMAADRGHEHASQLLNVVQVQGESQLPACMQPEPLPVAKPLPALSPLLAGQDDLPEPKIPMAPKEIVQLVQRLAPQYEVDSNLVLAVIFAESAFNPAAVSPARAQGLMQLIPETAERFGVKKPFNPDDNIKGGLSYLRWLLAYFQGDVSLVLAAYNAGEGAVEKHRGIPPYNETRDYVKKITAMYRRLTHPYNASVVRPSPLIEQLRRSL